MIRLKIRQDFERNRNITDLGIIDMLLHKNQQEYQETMNCWKQEVSHAVAFAVNLARARNDPLEPRSRADSAATPHALVQEL